jgi:FdhE protein
MRPEIREALTELADITESRPSFAGPAQVLRDAMPELFEGSALPAAQVISSDRARAKLDQGLPLLRDEPVPLDTRDFARRWQRMCTAVARHQDNSSAPALADAMRRGLLDPRQLTDATLAGRPEKIHARADELGLDTGLTATVLRLTLFPVMSQLSSDLSSLRAGVQWERGYCPICGSWPLLGEFRGLEQIRFLRCGLCAAEWEFPRSRCPFCDTCDHRRLDYFYAEAEEGKHRVATCAECRGYVKMVSSLTALSPPALLVADVATMHLDLIAASRGYQVGGCR